MAKTNLRKAVRRMRGRRYILQEAEIATGPRNVSDGAELWVQCGGGVTLSGITHFWISSQFCQESVNYPEFPRTEMGAGTAHILRPNR